MDRGGGRGDMIIQHAGKHDRILWTGSFGLQKSLDGQFWRCWSRFLSRMENDKFQAKKLQKYVSGADLMFQGGKHQIPLKKSKVRQQALVCADFLTFRMVFERI